MDAPDHGPRLRRRERGRDNAEDNQDDEEDARWRADEHQATPRGAGWRAAARSVAGAADSGNAMLTGALASNGLQSPSSLPISLNAGNTSSPRSRMHVRVSALDTNPSAAQKPTMDGRVSSSSRRSLGITVLGVPATII